MIIGASGVNDLVVALAFARANRLEISVRGCERVARARKAAAHPHADPDGLFHLAAYMASSARGLRL